MYLKCLEIQGFKSFPEKVKLEFDKGITTVVGPNGSGKSNISDSIRWVLGEQRVKNLRGDKMEDVIFAGTQNRKPLGFAEVSITLDNQDEKIAIDYTDVTVTRRVFRSGESEYLINGSVCKLRDIYELFMDTGIGKEGYSIIGQGKIDDILSTKSDDRRKLFEEAAGIVKYKNRKQEAVAKLEREKQNFIRINDIIYELEKNLAPLEKQAGNAKKFIKLSEDLKEFEINIFKLNAEKLNGEIEKNEENRKIAEENLNLEQSLHEKKKAESIFLKKNIDDYTENVQKTNDLLNEINSDLEKENGKIQVYNQKLENSDYNIKRLYSDVKLKNEKLSENENNINLYNVSINSVNISLELKKNKLAEKEDEFKQLSDILSESETHIEEYKTEMMEKLRSLTETKGTKDRTVSMLNQFKDRYDQILEEKDYLKSKINDNLTHISALKKQIETKNSENSDFEKRLKFLIEAKFELEKSIKQSQLSYDTLLSEYNELKSKLRVLQDMEKNHEGFYKSVKEVLKLREEKNIREEKNKGLKGICGAVGEILKVDKELETAIEIALGGSLQNIVVETENDAKAAIEFLKRNSYGRATFMPLSSVNGRVFSNDFKNDKGFIGIAFNLVSFDKRFENIAASLLGKIVIIDNIDNAISFSRKYKNQYKAVTLDGEVFNAGGSITGGSVSKKTTNIFSRNREISEISERIKDLNEKIISQKLIIEQSNENTAKYAIEVSQLKEMKNKNALELSYLEKEVEKSFNLKTEQDERMKKINLEENQLVLHIENAEKLISEQNISILKTEEEINEINKSIESFQGSMESEKDNRNNLLNLITELKIEISGLKQKKDSILENIERLDKDNEYIKKEIINFQNEIKCLEDDKSNVLKDIEKANSCVMVKRNLYDENIINLNDLMEKRKNSSEKVKEIEVYLEGKLENISQLKNDIFRIETKKEKLLEEKNRIYNDIWEKYEVTFSFAKQFCENNELPEAELLRKCTEAKGSIKALGYVNVNAVDEYREAKERYDFLQEQKSDILNAEEKLELIINELTNLMETQFKENFAVISENFNTVFSEMFGGGMAYLKLSDEDNVLESGIEIIAQPPGKTLQNMMLLSGGERALTAIAILFAILKIKPSPFCILDEIEAALDDANVKRYSNYLKKFSDETQFIVITHRKGTMEAADVMYGVTMQEQGVSKIVSVKFEEREEKAI